MVGMPGFLARFLARFLTRVFGQGFGDRKYSVQYYQDRDIQCRVLLGQKITVLQYEEKREKNQKSHMITKKSTPYSMNRLQLGF